MKRKLNSRVCSHVFFSTGENESRFFKEAKSLLRSKQADHIYFIGVQNEANSLPLKEKVDGVTFIRCKIRTRTLLPKNILCQSFKYLEWCLGVTLAYRRIKSKVIFAHSLASLPIACFLKLLYGCSVIYDAHEHETETVNSRGVRRKLLKFSESFFIKQTSLVFTVSDLISRDYNDWYDIEEVSLKNYPSHKTFYEIPEKYDLKKKLGIKDWEILFIYQGLFSKGRGIEEILKAFSKLEKDEGKHIVFMGRGDIGHLIQSYSEKYRHIHSHSFVPVEEVLFHTASADVGVSLVEPVSLSYIYCLPNKLFEYINSGLRVLVGEDTVEQAKLVREGKHGNIVKKGNLYRILKNYKKSMILPRGSRKYNFYTWEKQEGKMLNAYRSLLEEE